MAVRLRLRRIGKKKMPIYQVVAADSRAARNGKFLEIVGRYEPRQNPMLITMNESRTIYWLKSGALPTDTVKSLLQRSGLWLRWSMKRRGLDETAIAAEMEKWQMLQADKTRRDDERKARRLSSRRKAKKAAEAGASTPAPAATAETPAEA